MLYIMRRAPILKMPRQFVHREELGKLIAQTSGAISMINESNYEVRWRSGEKTYTVTAIKSGWTCSCPDYARLGRVENPDTLRIDASRTKHTISVDTTPKTIQ